MIILDYRNGENNSKALWFTYGCADQGVRFKLF